MPWPSAGRQPDSVVTAAQLLDQYVATAGWDVSILQSNLGYIRRTIKPALGSTQFRQVRVPLLDTLYARLMRCGNHACAGKPFTEHRNIPDLRPDRADRRLEWEQAADRVRAAIRSGQLTTGDTLPSVPDLTRLQGLKPGTVRHASRMAHNPATTGKSVTATTEHNDSPTRTAATAQRKVAASRQVLP